MVASTFTESIPMIRTNQTIALGLVAFGMYLNYAGAEHTKNWEEFASLIDMTKSYFADTLEPE